MRLVSTQLTPSWLGASLALGLLVHACSLNPQPLPPGDTSDGSVANGSSSDASGAPGDDAALGGGPTEDAAYDAPGVMGQVDAGDGATTDAASDAGDGGPDAAEGGLTDASGDAPNDAAEDGG